MQKRLGLGAECFLVQVSGLCLSNSCLITVMLVAVSLVYVFTPMRSPDPINISVRK